MDDNIKLSIIIILICVALMVGCHIVDNISWNNGKCSCGGSWEYQQAVGHRYSTNYVYKCDKCGKIAEFMDNYEVYE